MQHRFAYVGNDLQDLYGIDPATIGRANASGFDQVLTRGQFAVDVPSLLANLTGGPTLPNPN